MSVLEKLKRGGQNLPPRVILAGPEGIGKTTFAAQAPSPVFICPENGLEGMDHIPHLEPSSFSEILGLIDELIAAKDCLYQTVVIDTADWLERCIHQAICKRDNKNDVEDYGYGKGYTIAEVELTKLLAKLDTLRSTKRVGIIILSHVQIRTFQAPGGESWDRYEMKGNKRFTGLLREWPEACLFAVYEVYKTKERGDRKEKVIDGGRVIHTEWSPGWDAKNRLHLPATLSMPEDGAYDIFAKSVEENSPTRLRERFRSLLKTAAFTDEKEKAAFEAVNVDNLLPERIRAGITKLEAKQKK